MARSGTVWLGRPGTARIGADGKPRHGRSGEERMLWYGLAGHGRWRLVRLGPVRHGTASQVWHGRLGEAGRGVAGTGG